MNGMVERAIQTVKGLIRKASLSNSGISKAILKYNTTPKYGLPAPCEMIMATRFRTTQPCTQSLLIPKVDARNHLDTINNKSKKQA